MWSWASHSTSAKQLKTCEIEQDFPELCQQWKSVILKNHSLIHNDNFAESFQHHFMPKNPSSHIFPLMLLNVLPELRTRKEDILWKVKQLKGNCMMPSKSHSQTQNPGKGKKIYMLEPVYFLQERAIEFWGPEFFLIRAFGGIEGLQMGVFFSHPQCHKATSSSKTSLLHLEIWKGLSPHPFPFQCDWLQNLISKRNLQIQSQRRRWCNVCGTNPREMY